jgi:hypothetical protein
MPHQIPEKIATKAGPKPWLEPHIKQDMSEDASEEQQYLKARNRFPKLSFDSYYNNSCFFDDKDIQAALPSREAVRKHLDNHIRLLCESSYQGSQNAPLKQGLHDLIEKGHVGEGAKGIVVSYLRYYLISISSDVARQLFSSSNLYEEAIRPLLEKYPEIVREAAIQLAAVLIKPICNELKDKDDALMLSTSIAIYCPQLRYLIDDPEISQFLSADQLEVATKTLEQAAKLYNDDPDLYDYLEAAHDVLNMKDYYSFGAIPTSRAQLSC